MKIIFYVKKNSETTYYHIMKAEKSEVKDLTEIQNKIYTIRGIKVMIDKDLAELYSVQTKVLNQTVKRNIERFPEDFMFQLSDNEAEFLRSQFVTSNESRGGRRYLPFAFTQNGIAMLSSVLMSKKAIEVNIRIMRIFTRTGEILKNQTEIYKKIEQIEKQGQNNSADIQSIFTAIKEIIGFTTEKSKKSIGFDQ